MIIIAVITLYRQFDLTCCTVEWFICLSILKIMNEHQQTHTL